MEFTVNDNEMVALCGLPHIAFIRWLSIDNSYTGSFGALGR